MCVANIRLCLQCCFLVSLPRQTLNNFPSSCSWSWYEGSTGEMRQSYFFHTCNLWKYATHGSLCSGHCWELNDIRVKLTNKTVLLPGRWNRTLLKCNIGLEQKPYTIVWFIVVIWFPLDISIRTSALFYFSFGQCNLSFRLMTGALLISAKRKRRNGILAHRWKTLHLTACILFIYVP
jgi:hypothetical protein